MDRSRNVLCKIDIRINQKVKLKACISVKIYRVSILPMKTRLEVMMKHGLYNLIHVDLNVGCITKSKSLNHCTLNFLNYKTLL